MILSALMGESRSLIAALVLNIVLTWLVFLFFSGKKYAGNLVKFCFGIVFVLLLGVTLISFLPIGNTLFSVYDRFNEVLQTGTSDSYQTRAITNAYYLELIKSNLFGHGLGSSMWLIGTSGSKVQEGLFIDNGFITLLYKMGIPGFLFFILFYISNLSKMFKSFIKNKNSVHGKLALIIFLSFPAYFINGMFFTTQLVMNATIFGFILMIFAFFRTSRPSSL
jgi:O-antigen ligase